MDMPIILWNIDLHFKMALMVKFNCNDVVLTAFAQCRLRDELPCLDSFGVCFFSLLLKWVFKYTRNCGCFVKIFTRLEQSLGCIHGNP